LLAVDGDDVGQFAACERAGLELVGVGGVGERFLPAAELDQRRDLGYYRPSE
jgi:hypothetical protein